MIRFEEMSVLREWEKRELYTQHRSKNHYYSLVEEQVMYDTFLCMIWAERQPKATLIETSAFQLQTQINLRYFFCSQSYFFYQLQMCLFHKGFQSRNGIFTSLQLDGFFGNTGDNDIMCVCKFLEYDWELSRHLLHRQSGHQLKFVHWHKISGSYFRI